MDILKKQDIQEILNEEFDNTWGISSDYDIQKTPREVWKEEDFKAMLNNYKRKHGIDLQEELGTEIKPHAIEKLKASLDGKDINNVKENEQKEIAKEKESLSKEGIALDKKDEKKLEKKIDDEKGQNSQGEVNIRAEALKAIYSSALEDYYNLKTNLQTGANGQVKTGSLSVSDKMGTKLVMYERYLQKLDTRYRGITGTNIVKDDDEIRNDEIKFALKDEYNEKNINKKFQKNVDVINDLLDKRAEIEEKMAVVIGQSNMLSVDDFNSQINALQEDYIEVTAKLHTVEPNIHELQQDVNMHEKNDDFRDRTLGGAFDKYHNRNLDSRVSRADYANDERNDDVKDKFNDSVGTNFKSTQDVAEDALEEYWEAESKGDPRAEEILQTAEGLAGISTAERETPSENETDVKSHEEYNESVDEMSKDDDNDKDLFDPRLNAVANDEETLRQEKEREEKEERERRAEEVQEQINSNRAMERTLYNRK